MLLRLLSGQKPEVSNLVLHHSLLIFPLSEMVTESMSLPQQSCTSHYNAGTWGIVQGQLRHLLAPRVYTLPMVRSIGKTMVQGKNYGPQITVKRISTRLVSVSAQMCLCA